MESINATSNKNVKVYPREELYKECIGYFPTKVNDPNEVETLLVPNPDLKFYKTELPEVFKTLNYAITAPAYYVLTHERDDCFISDMIAENQVNDLMADKLEEFINEAFNKYPDNEREATNYLNDVLLENFLTDNKSFNVIY